MSSAILQNVIFRDIQVNDEFWADSTCAVCRETIQASPAVAHDNPVRPTAQKVCAIHKDCLEQQRLAGRGTCITCNRTITHLNDQAFVPAPPPNGPAEMDFLTQVTLFGSPIGEQIPQNSNIEPVVSIGPSIPNIEPVVLIGDYVQRGRNVQIRELTPRISRVRIY